VPPASTGFQLSLGVGLMAPFGGAGDGSAMSGLPVQLLLADLGLGGKINESWYLGAYAGLAAGGAGSFGCDGCAAGSARLGIEARYSFAPAARWNPWVGYGLGFEALSVGTNDNGESIGRSGFELARLTGGVDARLVKGFGLGPYVGLSLGEYTSESTTNDSSNISATTSSPIANKSLHGWLTLGVRFVIFP
jgi:hypothetical protein